MKRLGPDLKMPDLKELKAPTFLADVYLDLRDRRLLPLIALVAVAIVAVPFLLGSDPEPLPPPATAGEIAGDEATGANNLTVVEAKPGLRDYRKRLRARSATDPFKQRYTSLPKAAQLQSTTTTTSAGGAGGGSSEVSVTEVEGSVTETETPPSGGAAPGSSGGGGRGTGGGSKGGSKDDDGLRFFAFRPDVRFGVAGSGDLSEREELPLGTLLPKRNPVIVFLAVSEDGKRAFFDVSHEVAMVKSPGRCIGGPQSCSMLILRVGQAADILTGKPGRAFRLKVVQIEFVEVKRPKPAGTSSAPSGRRHGSDLSVVGQFGFADRLP